MQTIHGWLVVSIIGYNCNEDTAGIRHLENAKYNTLELPNVLLNVKVECKLSFNDPNFSYI